MGSRGTALARACGWSSCHTPVARLLRYPPVAHAPYGPLLHYIITGQPTHSVGGPDYQRLLASVVVYRRPTHSHMQRNSPGVVRDGGPVVLRPVRATPCYITLQIIVINVSRNFNHFTKLVIISTV